MWRSKRKGEGSPLRSSHGPGLLHTGEAIMLRSVTALLVVVLSVCGGQAAAWGVAGHQIVATIAQIHLHDNVRETVAQLLPFYAKGRLAPIAAWADRVSLSPSTYLTW